MKKLIFALALLCSCAAVQAKRVGVYCFLDNIENHLYEDDNVKVVIAVGGAVPFQLAIYNKTDNVVYVDKENSFVYTNGIPQNLFGNTSQTTGSMSGSGASLNLGGVANALGIGGAAGSILGGVTVGGNSGQVNTTTVYEKRILTLAPKSGAILYTWEHTVELETMMGVSSIPGYAGKFIDQRTGEKIKMQKGMVRNYQRETSPLQLKGIVKYALEEAFAAPTQVTVDNFLSDIVIDSYKGIKNPNEYLPYCIPYKDKQCYRFQAGTPWAGTAPGLLTFCAGPPAALIGTLLILPK
ncbi:MAG: hypothetical protein IJ710_02035 [Prevotella sp.]|nr:hypothetical protein [Prevotella sp.]